MTGPLRLGRVRVGKTGKGILLLISGTMGAQLVSFIALPLLSRLYTPEDFGYFSVVMAIVGIVSTVATLRYESAAMLPTQLEEVRALVWLALGAVFSVALLTFVVLQVAASQGWFGLAGYPRSAVWVTALVVLGAAFAIMSQLAIRKQQYKLVAHRSFLRSVLTSAGQLGLGWGTRASSGLLMGSAIGSLGGLAILWRSTKEFLAPPPRELVRPTMRRYWRFPAVFAPSALLNGLGLQAPLLFITAVFGLGVGGQLGMAEKIVAVPIALVGGAVSQAVDAEVAKRIRDGLQDLRPIFWRFSRLLGSVAIAVAVGGSLFGAVVVPSLLGSDWSLAGTLVQILALTASVRLVASPLSKFIDLLQRSAANAALDLLRVGLMGLAIAVVLFFRLGLISAVWTIYTSLAVTYAATWLYVLVAVRRRADSSDDSSASNTSTRALGD